MKTFYWLLSNEILNQWNFFQVFEAISTATSEDNLNGVNTFRFFTTLILRDYLR